jgi:hypothetical protein
MGYIIANASALLQELLWKEQRITPKFSFIPHSHFSGTKCLTLAEQGRITTDKPVAFSYLHTLKTQKSLNGLICIVVMVNGMLTGKVKITGCFDGKMERSRRFI